MKKRIDKSIGKRLRQAREQLGYRYRTEAARAFPNVEVETLRSHETGRRGIELEAAKVYAAAFRINLQWLMHGTPEEKGVAVIKSSHYRLVPIIQWGQIKEFCDNIELFKDHQEHGMAAADHDVGERAFIVRVVDDSMSPEFNMGDEILCNPDAPLTPGCYVVACLTGEEKGILRKYRPRGAAANGSTVTELTPINQDWPTIQLDDSTTAPIIARVVRHSRRL